MEIDCANGLLTTIRLSCYVPACSCCVQIIPNNCLLGCLIARVRLKWRVMVAHELCTVRNVCPTSDQLVCVCVSRSPPKYKTTTISFVTKPPVFHVVA